MTIVEGGHVKKGSIVLLQLCKTSGEDRRAEENTGNRAVCCGIGRTLWILSRKYMNWKED